MFHKIVKFEILLFKWTKILVWSKNELKCTLEGAQLSSEAYIKTKRKTLDNWKADFIRLDTDRDREVNRNQ